jgi:hypothetical protein
MHFFIWLVGGGIQLGPLGMSGTSWPVVPAPGDYEDGEFGGMLIGRGNGSTQRKPAPVPLCPPQIPHDLIGCKPGRLTAWTMAQPLKMHFGLHVNCLLFNFFNKIEICWQIWIKLHDITVGFEVFMVITVKNTVLWVVMLCSLERAWHFRGTYCLHV